ncbi:unnamed protein product, partial [Aphanomyces euteiches]
MASGSVAQQALLSLQCPDASYRLTRVLFASYGQPTGRDLGAKYALCHSSSSQAQVEAACLNKNSCSVSASDSVFGSPCGGAKTLTVTAECTKQVQYAAAGVVADKGKFVLQCLDGYEIYGITAATYGQPNPNCNVLQNTGTAWQCIGGHHTPVRINPITGDVECMANNHRDCFWSGTYTNCVNAITANPPSTLQPLSCGYGHLTEYGDPGYGNPGHWCADVLRLLTSDCIGTCNATSTYSTVNTLCLNQQSCTIPAESVVFSDPCVGAQKSLGIAYRCRQTTKDVGSVYTTLLAPKCPT